MCACTTPTRPTTCSVCPGPIQTRATELHAESQGRTVEEIVDEMSSQLMIKRMGKPREIASAVLFLVRAPTSFYRALFLGAGCCDPLLCLCRLRTMRHLRPVPICSWTAGTLQSSDVSVQVRLLLASASPTLLFANQARTLQVAFEPLNLLGDRVIFCRNTLGT